MIDEGEGAPAFELPAVVGGEIERVALADYLGSNVIILAFYPADFNPACDDGETDLDELDLFTMQKDVSILAISGDSVYSHRAFAAEYDLHIPLLADTTGEVAADYDVAVDDPDAGYRTKRAVAVIGPGGDVEYAWSTDDLRQLPPVEHVREAVDDVGGSETAVARYRVGHAHYVEGRRAFTSAMGFFGENEWMMSQSDFMRAKEEFEEAAAQFNTAVRFGEDEDAVAYFERAEDKAELLWQAAEWLADAASAYASGEGAEGQSMREDAETPLEEARRYGEPPDPDDFPPEEPPPPLEDTDEEQESILPDDEEDVDTTLDVDIDEDAYADGDVRESVEGQGADGSAAAETADSDVVSGVSSDESGAADPAEADSSPGAADDGDEAGEDGEEDSIDEAELEEITAQLEQQTEEAQAEHEREQAAEDDGEIDGDSDRDGDVADAGDEIVEDDVDGDDAGADAEDDEVSGVDEGTDETADESVDGEGDDVELELTDPTGGDGLDPLEDDDDGEDDEQREDEQGEDGTDDSASEDLGGGGHGVPDSL